MKGLLRVRAVISPTEEIVVTAQVQEAPALAVHAERVDPVLQGVLDALSHALDLTTREVLDRCSASLAAVRQERREDKQLLQEEMLHWCRELHQQGASELRAPVIRRDRQCCSVKRGRSGVRCQPMCMGVQSLPCQSSSAWDLTTAVEDSEHGSGHFM